MGRRRLVSFIFISVFYVVGVFDSPSLSSAGGATDSFDHHVNVIFNSTACDTPCQNGTFEVMKCSDQHPKLCKGRLLLLLILLIY